MAASCGAARIGPQVVEAPEVLRADACAAEPLGVERDLLLRPLEEPLQLVELEGVELLAGHRLVARVPVRRISHPASRDRRS
jgi:hypothetical protein